MEHIDPLNGQPLQIKSKYYPEVTLLQGREWNRHPTILEKYRQDTQNDNSKSYAGVRTPNGT